MAAHFPKSGIHNLLVQLRALLKGVFSHRPGRILELFTFGDMYIGLQHIPVYLLLFDLGCCTPTSLVFSSRQTAANHILGPALSIQLSSNVFLTSSKNITNATLSAAPLTLPNPNVTTLSTYIPFKVPNTKITLEFHGFGSFLSKNDFVFTIAAALAMVLQHCIRGRGSIPILLGFFRYTHEFDSGNITRFSVGDFREIGRPMTWDALADTLKGLVDFTKEPGQSITEVSFEVEQAGIGYVASGRFDHVSSSSSSLV